MKHTPPTLSPEAATHFRAATLCQDHGEPSEQKDKLVAHILAAFESPEKWPMTDQECIALLKEIYRKAETIRRTERAIAAAK